MLKVGSREWNLTSCEECNSPIGGDFFLIGKAISFFFFLLLRFREEREQKEFSSGIIK